MLIIVICLTEEYHAVMAFSVGHLFQFVQASMASKSVFTVMLMFFIFVDELLFANFMDASCK